MQRDFESMNEEAKADAYWDARDEQRAQHEADLNGDEPEAEEETEPEAQEAPARYTVTMTSEQYQMVYSVVSWAEIQWGTRASTARVPVAREFAAEDQAKAKAAMAILDSLNYQRVA